MSLPSKNRLPSFGAPLALKAYAKVNLSLRITGKRPDGYHELETWMCPIDLADELVLSPGQPGIRLQVAGGRWPVPVTAENLAFRAADVFFNRTGLPAALDILLDKRIPVAAGLGGGSSDAAAVLRGLNGVFGAPLSGEALHAAAVGLGADVPFFLGEGAAWARGIGDVLEPLRNVMPLPLVLVNPGKVLSTAEVYKNLKWGLTKEGIKTKKPHFEEALMDPMPWLFNDLEPVARAMCAEVEQASRILSGMGAQGVLMSGSGPTVFGFFSSPDVARETASVLSGCYPDWFVLATRLLP